MIPQSSPEDEPEEASVVEAFHKPTLDLAIILLQSMQVIGQQILVCYNDPWPSASREKQPDIIAIQERLTGSANIAREHLQEICDDLDAQKRKPSGDVQLPKRVLDTCTCTILLLQVG